MEKVDEYPQGHQRPVLVERARRDMLADAVDSPSIDFACPASPSPVEHPAVVIPGFPGDRGPPGRRTSWCLWNLRGGVRRGHQGLQTTRSQRA